MHNQHNEAPAEISLHTQHAVLRLEVCMTALSDCCDRMRDVGIKAFPEAAVVVPDVFPSQVDARLPQVVLGDMIASQPRACGQSATIGQWGCT